MDLLRSLERLFKQHPELGYLTGFILLLAFSGFAYLVYLYLFKQKQRGNAMPANLEAAPAVELDFSRSPAIHSKREEVLLGRDPSQEAQGVERQPPSAYPAATSESTTGNRENLVIVSKPAPAPHVIFPANDFPGGERPVANTDEINTSISAGAQQKAPQPYDAGSDPAITKGSAMPDKSIDDASAKRKTRGRVPGRPSKLSGPKALVKSLDVPRIGYHPTKQFYQAGVWSYPYVLMPQVRSVVRMQHQNHNRVRGYMEARFQALLQQVFIDCTITGNQCIPIAADSLPVDMDITLAIQKGGINLLVNIEIDEPYAAHMRTPLHCIGDDELRDAWLAKRGWMVIRFSEHQVATMPDRCVAFIGKVIRSVHASFVVPEPLINLQDPDKEPQWTVAQAQQWHLLRFRENYLGIKVFERVTLPENYTEITPGAQDMAAEQLVGPDVSQQIARSSNYSVNIRNLHLRDARIGMIEGKDMYVVDGCPFRSVASIIEHCFPALDVEFMSRGDVNPVGHIPVVIGDLKLQEDKSAQTAAQNMHAAIEQLLQGMPVDGTTELQYFQNFLQDHRYLQHFRTQWHIFDELHHVGGTVDMAVKNDDGTYDIYDWVRSNRVVDFLGRPFLTHPKGVTAMGAFLHVHDTAYNRCCLEQNVYKYILDHYYGLDIRNMYLVILHPDLENYIKVEVQLMQSEAELVIAAPY